MRLDLTFCSPELCVLGAGDRWTGDRRMGTDTVCVDFRVDDSLLLLLTDAPIKMTKSVTRRH